MTALRDLMSTDVVTLQTCDRAADAWQTLRERGARHAVVVHDGAVVGLLSLGDLGNARNGAPRVGRVVGELMSREIVSGAPEMDVAAAATLMRANGVSCLPVLQQGRLAGLVTAGDLLALLEDRRELP